MFKTKKLLLFIAFIALYLHASFSLVAAELVSVAPKLGLDVYSIANNLRHGDWLHEPVYGNVGVLARLHLLGLSTSLEIGLATELFRDESKRVRLGALGLNVPFLFGVRFLFLPELQIGPFVYFPLYRADSCKAYSAHPAAIGVQVGISMDVWKLIISLNYKAQLITYKDSTFNLDIKSMRSTLSVGWIYKST